MKAHCGDRPRIQNPTCELVATIGLSLRGRGRFRLWSGATVMTMATMTQTLPDVTPVGVEMASPLLNERRQIVAQLSTEFSEPPPSMELKPSPVRDLATIAADAGIRRARFISWRDLGDPEAGGSELHAHKIATQWAAAGIEVTFRTSAVAGAPESITRSGYGVLRRAGRYGVFPGAAWESIRMEHRPGDALVEIWNGMPFLSPVWYRGPRLVFLHHVHGKMWGMVLPSALARAGETMERRLAPRLYRSEPHCHTLGVFAH